MGNGLAGIIRVNINRDLNTHNSTQMSIRHMLWIMATGVRKLVQRQHFYRTIKNIILLLPSANQIKFFFFGGGGGGLPPKQASRKP